ncbi:MAG: hypothetical protein IVW52_04830 [Acidimicrobiales bacterium]|nr:hypothetical protein [Acidimicrobiales bacterium]
MAEYYEDLERSYGPREARRIALERGLEVPPEPEESDRRLRCWALDVRVQEQTSFLEDLARNLSRARSPSYRETAKGVIETQVRILDDLFRRSEDCGVEANGYISGEFAGVQSVVGSGGPDEIHRVVAEFGRNLHRSAVDEIAGNTEEPG